MIGWWIYGVACIGAAIGLFWWDRKHPMQLWAEDDHWCGACALGQALEEKFAAYHRQAPPEREECPLTLDEEDQFAEITRGWDWWSRR